MRVAKPRTYPAVPRVAKFSGVTLLDCMCFIRELKVTNINTIHSRQSRATAAANRILPVANERQFCRVDRNMIQRTHFLAPTFQLRASVL